MRAQRRGQREHIAEELAMEEQDLALDHEEFLAECEALGEWDPYGWDLYEGFW